MSDCFVLLCTRMTNDGDFDDDDETMKLRVDGQKKL